MKIMRTIWEVKRTLTWKFNDSFFCSKSFQNNFTMFEKISRTLSLQEFCFCSYLNNFQVK